VDILTRENLSRDGGGILHCPPTASFLPKNIEELQRVLAEASEKKTPLVVRGGGKTTEGESLATKEESVIHMRALNKVIDFDEKSVLVEGGACYQELQNYLKPNNLDIISAPLNISATVGGTLGVGGIDVNSAFEGCSADQVIEMDVVLPSGELKNCSESKNSELFEAVLYGYGQFAVIARARIKVKKKSAIRLEFLYHNRFEEALSDLLTLEKSKLCHHLAILTLRDDVFCLIVGFEDEERYQLFLKSRSSLAGVSEGVLFFKKVKDFFSQPSLLTRLPFLAQSRGKILSHLQDPRFFREGLLHNRHAAFGKLIWAYWGKQPLVIPDLSLTLANFKQGVMEGNEICKRYFPYYTLYIVLVKKQGWKPRYHMGPFPETEECLMGGVEFEPLFLDLEKDREKIQDFKNEIYELGVKLNGRAYRFGGAMKDFAQRFCGEKNWQEFLDQKALYDPQDILNSAVLR
jgi:FAD/FMN-containing dehydrogenase